MINFLHRLLFFCPGLLHPRPSYDSHVPGGPEKAGFMRSYLTTIILLSLSNIFMTFAWYGHLRNMSHTPWVVAAFASWGIALLEYLLQVPANRIGHQVMNVGQLKILQECIALSVFIPFSILYMKEKPSMDYVWAGLCILGAAFFMFRKKIMGA